MSSDGKYNPYRSPSPYDILGVTNVLEADARDITKAHKDRIKENRLIRDPQERALRKQHLDEALAQLLRPDDRVLHDFFVLGENLFADLCIQYAEKLAAHIEPLTPAVVGAMTATRKFDDLVPTNLDSLTAEFVLGQPPEFFDELSPLPRLPIVEAVL